MPKILKAVEFSNQFSEKLIKTWRVLFLTLGGLGLGLSGLLKIYETFLQYIPPILPLEFLGYKQLLLGIGLIFTPLGLSLAFFEIFIAFWSKDPELKPNQPAIEYLDFDTARIFYKAAQFASKKSGAIKIDMLLVATLGDQAATALWQRLEIDPISLEKQISTLLSYDSSSPVFSWGGMKFEFDEDVKKCLEIMNFLRQEHGSRRILVTDLLIALFDTDELLKTMLYELNIDRGDLIDLGLWFESLIERRRKRKRFWDLDNLLRKPPIGVNWVYGYTPLLDHFAEDISKYFETGSKEVRLIGRQEVVSQMETILSRSGENNVLLVGEPGVGRHTVIYGFADLIAKGHALPALKYKRVLSLNVALLVSSAPSTQEMEATLLRVLKDAERAGNIILVIDEIHNFMGTKEGVGKIDISEILKPYLSSSRFQLIALTDHQNFHRYIEPRADLMRLFSKIEIQEPDRAKTTQILQTILPTIEEAQGVMITHPALENIVEKAEFFIPEVPFPEKAIDLLTEVAADVAKQGRKIVLTEDVNKTVTKKTNVPLGEISGSEKEKIESLEKLMHEDIVNQGVAIKRLSETMLRLRVGLSKREKPAGVFLFIGPTGVGKTLTAKILAKVYFGDEERMIRFDMSEFQEVESIDRFIGSLRTNEPGQFTSRLREKPFSVVLLDEVEKAHPNILNLFLPVFDEARITDVFGKTVSLKQNIIIATSNAGSEYIRELVNQNTDPAQEKELILDYILKNHLFTPELLNRFDEIVVYHPLSHEQIIDVTKILLAKLAARLKEQSYFFIPNDELINYIVQIGFDPQFGARPMQRAIQNTLEVVIARKILNKEIRRGEEFTIGLEELPR